MAQTPIYDHDGSFNGTIQDGNMSFPAIPENRHGKAFLDGLAAKSQTLEQWLAANPYVPPEKSVEQLADEKEAGDLKRINPATVTDPTVKLLLQRELRRLG